MLTRIVTGIIAGAFFLLILFLGSIPLTLLMTIIAVIAYLEWMAMKRISRGSAISIIGVLAIISLFLGTSFFSLNPVSILWLAIIVLLMQSVFRRQQANINDVAYVFLAVFYTGYGFWLLIQAREESFLLVLFILISIWLTDSGAYFIGKKFGKRKLAPNISPNKTTEGFIGGVLTAVVGAYLLTLIAGESPIDNILTTIGTAMIISVFGQLGDLVESAMKRYLDVKDSGRILPGHGGLLDRFDSLLFVLPILSILGLF